ncbi:hypothetical protein EVAR_25576_1 [Eumeta japonica]|uniref:Uncharacterized protein n=1 Tax=Eumeta variegata TaxID=151549 RepID=A0A4C1V208_EUMVA|nr:hypothetical protein EVAR_25576_1 [Eumeta japonica]
MEAYVSSGSNNDDPRKCHKMIPIHTSLQHLPAGGSGAGASNTIPTSRPHLGLISKTTISARNVGRSPAVFSAPAARTISAGDDRRTRETARAPVTPLPCRRRRCPSTLNRKSCRVATTPVPARGALLLSLSLAASAERNVVHARGAVLKIQCVQNKNIKKNGRQSARALSPRTKLRHVESAVSDCSIKLPDVVTSLVRTAPDPRWTSGPNFLVPNKRLRKDVSQQQNE